MTTSPLKVKSYEFAKAIVRAVHTIQREHREFILSKQLLRSGTAIGALVREAEYAQSRSDFIHKLSIALKEANKSLYWLNLKRYRTHPSGDLSTAQRIVQGTHRPAGQFDQDPQVQTGMTTLAEQPRQLSISTSGRG